VNPYIADSDFELYVGDVRDVLKTLPAESVHCVVTSPPYWGLRDYGTGEWEGGDAECDHKRVERVMHAGRQGNAYGTPPGAGRMGDEYYNNTCGKCGATRVDKQLGLEPTPEEYVANMVEVFREVRRVLRADGTCWVNLGSSYFNGESYPLREIDAAWLAAVIDGEGCIQVHQQRRPERANSVDSFQVDLSVGMVTPEVVQRCHEITGLGSCKLQARGVWDWSVRGQQAAQLLRAIYPYLLGKRRQAALAIMLANDLADRRYGRGNPAQPEVMEWRAQLRKAVSDCNQRRDTDFPIVEPKPITLNLKPKDDVGIPHKMYFALRDDGWYARMDVVWGKLNPMPESVTDRPTKAHEYVFLLTRSPRYYYDAEAIREPHVAPELNGKAFGSGQIGTAKGVDHGGWGNLTERVYNPAGRNRRSVWEIATEPYPEAHFATFPQALVEPCIKAGCPEGETVLDPFLGSGTTAHVARRLGRKCIGIELNPAYAELAAKRLSQLSLLAEGAA